MSELSPVLTSALLDEEDIDRVTYVVRNLALSSGFDALNANLLAAATSELATNAVVHGGGGRFSVGPTTDGRGLEIVISDDGPGIDDIERAFFEGYSTRQGGLGIGLSAVRRAATDVDVRSAPGRGTTVTMRHFLPPPRVWLELGIGSRPDPTSEENGGLIVHRGLPNDQLLVAIVDSLDRGPEARAVSTAAAEVLISTTAIDPGDMLQEAHRAVRKSDDDDGHNGLIAAALVADRYRLTLAAIGDMTTRILAKDGTEPFSFDMSPGRLGTSGPAAVVTRRFDVSDDDRPLVVILADDGLAPGFQPDHLGLRDPVNVIAERLLSKHRRHTDDASVAVVRLARS